MNPPMNGRGSVPPTSEGPRATNSSTHSTSHPRPPPINPPPPQPVAITVNGEANLSVRPHATSRDSQISLPEEAKRYYATMASPAVSPGMKFNFPSAPSSPLKQETYAEQSSSSSQSGMTDETSGVSGTNGVQVGLGLPSEAAGAGASHAQAQAQAAGAGGRGRTNGRVPGSHRAGSVTTEEGAEFLDLDDEDSAYDSGANGASSGSANVPSFDDSTLVQNGDARRRDRDTVRKPPAVDDFPLPPSSTGVSAQYASRQGNSTDTGASRPSLSTSDSHGNLAPSLASASSLTLAQEQPPASPFPLPLPQGLPRMEFRALPLLAEDLPYTDIVVSSSTIRPNDRGKDVLSFIISVDPGRGKESWRVEKLYSDVLGLDARVRATVGRSAAKKLASLPEGRLWRDHAPAKVDQRKVRRCLYTALVPFSLFLFPSLLCALRFVLSWSLLTAEVSCRAPPRQLSSGVFGHVGGPERISRFRRRW